MHVNPKKSIKLKNRTNFFNPDTTRTHVRFSSPNSYQSRQQKIEGYETRLYWQFRYCEDHNGQTFFYTLTYNDANLPKRYGVNCFDYEDLRYLFTGGFRKQLLRKYGTTFKYFVGAELGDGKGSRGMHNNPHYHVLFFLEPANNDKYPYIKISADDFRHLVRMYWQGFDESRTGYRDYNEAFYGIAREGENQGKVTDFRACMYCAKYVCKDAKLKMAEKDVEKKVRFEVKKKFKFSEDSYRLFFTSFIYPRYNTPLNAKCTEWCFTDRELIEYLCPGSFILQYNLFWRIEPIKCYTQYIPNVIDKLKIWQDYFDFVDSYIEPQVKEGLNEWRNRYCNKCRISQGVGDYALEFIKDLTNPFIQVPSKKGFKNRPIGMYYYRKLYTDVKKDCKGMNIRVLNDAGIRYKVARLNSQIRKMSSQAKNNLTVISQNEDLYNKMLVSDINTDNNMTFREFSRSLRFLLKDNLIDNIVKRYAEYKLVYEDRYFRYFKNGDCKSGDFPVIDVTGDYRRFLFPSFYSVPRNDLMLDSFLEDDDKDYLPYHTHPYFLRYIGIFNVLDMCSDYFFIQDDNKKQTEAEERSRVKRFHDQRRLKDFYKVFSIAS